MNILVSSCLLGERCRYDGKSKGVNEVIALSKKYNLIPICPEVMGGLSVPRDPCEIIGDRLVSKEGRDCTAEYNKGAQIALEIALKHNCKYAVLKLKSPSCSVNGVYDGTFSKTLVEGMGVTAKLLSQNGIKVLGENQIHLIKEG